MRLLQICCARSVCHLFCLRGVWPPGRFALVELETEGRRTPGVRCRRMDRDAAGPPGAPSAEGRTAGLGASRTADSRAHRPADSAPSALKGSVREIVMFSAGVFILATDGSQWHTNHPQAGWL